MSFCSRAALTARDSLAGTGVHGRAYVFLPVPKRFWGPNELNPAWASPRELDAIRAVRREGVVVRLYNPARDAAAPEPVLVYTAEDEAPPPLLYEFLDDLDRSWPVDLSRLPSLAVCTHGTRDRCCAKWGFAVYGAARRLFEMGASPFRPVECSHLGGDRFAATGVFFPSGSMYAHLDSLDLAALAVREAEGRLAPEHYRGRVFDSQLTQVVRAGLARDGLFDRASAPLAVSRPQPGEMEVRASVEGGRRQFLVSLAAVKVSFYASCDDMAEGKASATRRTVYAGARPLGLPETGP